MKRIERIVMLSFAIAVCTSCSPSPKQGKEETVTTDEMQDYFAAALSEEEMEQSHLTLTLMENIYVDADITPYSRYKDGLNAYYISDYVEAENVYTEEALEERTTFCHWEAADFLNIFEKYTNASFDLSEKIIQAFVSGDDSNIGHMRLTLPVHKNEEEQGDDFNYYFTWNWNWWINQGRTILPCFTYCDYSYESNNINQFLNKIPAYIEEYIPDCEKNSLAFADAEKLGKELKDMLEDILGVTLHEEYTCIPVGSKNYETLLEILSEEELAEMRTVDSGEQVILQEFPKENEYYSYGFLRDIDGFQWRELIIDLTVTDDMVLSETVEAAHVDSFVTSLSEYEQKVCYDKDGIYEMHLYRTANIDELYKEREAVLDINQLLNVLRECYADQLILYPITIQNIEICYASYFSNPDEGMVRDEVQPFWIVTYYDSQYQTEVQKIIDAYTGTIIR